MNKIAIIYWSGSGNTEKMAQEIAAGVQSAGAAADLFFVDQISASSCTNYDGVIFGCPAMGNEVLEERSFEPFFLAAEPRLAEKPTALFGSYGWGDGEWMRAWEKRARDANAALFGRNLIVQDAPDDNDREECRAFGRDFTKNFR